MRQEPGCGKVLALEVRKTLSGVPTDLPELGSNSQALLGSVEEAVLGSLGHTEAKDAMFSLLATTDATGYHGRAENEWGPSGGLWPGD